jgi:hypothetical protein
MLDGTDAVRVVTSDDAAEDETTSALTPPSSVNNATKYLVDE